MLGILAVALIFVAGNVAYFEMVLPSPTSLLPTHAVTSKWNVNRDSGTEKRQPALAPTIRLPGSPNFAIPKM